MRCKWIYKFTPIMLIAVFLFSGCSAGEYAGGSDSGTGALSMTVNWPDSQQNANEKGVRYIPLGSVAIQAVISGKGMDSPITSSITYPQTVLSVNDLPGGPKVALVKAFDGSNALKAQRKETFIIEGGKTVHSDSIPLGIAVTGTTGTPVFEPSSLRIPPGTVLPVQNWLNSTYACRMNIGGTNQDKQLLAPTLGSEGEWIFSEKTWNPSGYCPTSLIGYGSASMNIVGKGQIVQSVKTYVTDYWPSGSNNPPQGTYGVRIQRCSNTGASYADLSPGYLSGADPGLVFNSSPGSSTFYYSSNYQWYCPSVSISGHNINTDPAGSDNRHTYKNLCSVIRVTLNTYNNAATGNVRITGQVYHGSTISSRKVKFRIYKGSGNFGSPLWSVEKTGGSSASYINGNANGLLISNYTKNEELFFVVEPMYLVQNYGQFWDLALQGQ